MVVNNNFQGNSWGTGGILANTGAFPGLSLEQTNRIKEQSKLMSTNSYDQMLIQDDMYKQELSKQRHENFVQERQMGRMQLEQKIQEARDPKTKTTDTSVKSMAALADMYRQYGYEHGKNWDDIQDEQLISRFNTKNPQVKKLADNFLTGGDDSEYKLAQQLGLSQDGYLKWKGNLAKEQLDDAFWSNLWSKMKVGYNQSLDTLEKAVYRTSRDIDNAYNEMWKYLANNVSLKKRMEKKLGREVSDEEYQQLVQRSLDQYDRNILRNKNEVMDQMALVNDEARKYAEKNKLNEDIEAYYNNKSMTKSLLEGDFKGFLYKSAGDMAQNWEVLPIIGVTAMNPTVGKVLMGTDSYLKESQEAFENMINNGATFEEAEKGAVVVGLVNAGVEVGLESMLGGVETRSADAIRKTFMKNVQQEAVSRGFWKTVMRAGSEYLKASGEEGLEEVVQQIVQNAAAKTVNENQKLFEGIGLAFEGGAYNPLNLLAGGNISHNYSNNANLVNNVNTEANTVESNNTENNGLLDKVTDFGAELITNTVSNQDKLYKAQEPRMNTLTSKKNLETRRANSDRANQLIIENGYVPTNTAERVEAHQATLNKLWNQVKSKINEGKGIPVDQSSIIENLENYINEKKNLNVAAIEGDIAALEKELESLKKSQEDGTADLPVLENKKQVYNDIANWKEHEASKVYNDGIKLITSEIGKIEDQLLSEIPGDFSNLKKDVGALIDSYEDVFKADMKNQRSKGVGLTEAYSRIEGVGDIIEGTLGIFKGEGGKVIQGAGKVLLGKSLAKAKDLDFLVEQGFKGLAEEYKAKQAENGRVMNNEVDTSNPVGEMTSEEEYQEMVNRIMTPKEVETIVNMAWGANNLRDFYDGEYRTALEWLKGEGSDQVAMYAENTLATQRMIESHPELLDGSTYFSEVLDAYLNGTLTGKPKETIERMDLSKSEEYTPTKFYEPQQMRNAQEVWDEANKRVTNANRQEVYQARGEFVIDAHNPGFTEELGLTDAEVNKKLMSWAAYPAKAKDLSNKINDGVAAAYKWAGLENSSIVKSMTVSDADLEKMVKAVEGNSQEYERKYISNTMLALDTHIDRSPLTFNFVRGGTLNHTDGYNRHHEVLGNYDEQTNTVNIATAGQNTVAHEMGHYLDYLWGRQLFGKNVTLSEGGGRNLETLTTDQQKFVKHFDSFMLGLKTSADTYSEYTITPTEVFARFVARFTEWTRNTATNNRFGYETKWYNDKFIENDYVEFAKILQEKSKLDLANEYASYEEYKGKHEQWRGEDSGGEKIHEDMLKPLPDKIMKNVKVVGDRKDGGKIYEGVRGELAERLLLNKGEGMVRDAYTFRGEPVNLIWGEYDVDNETGKGLAKISKKHPNILGKIQSLLDKLKVKEENSQKVILGDGNYKLVLRKDYDGEKMNWVLTAYEKE